MHKQEETFNDVVSEITGESEYTLIAFARTIENPLDYLQSVKEDVKAATVDLNKYEQEYTDFLDRIAEFEATFDTALTDADRMAYQYDRWEEIYDAKEYSPVGQDFDRNYNPRQRFRDTHDLDSPVFFYEQKSRSSRDEWKRVTKDSNPRLAILCDWGNFELGATQRYHRSLLRIRTTVRRIGKFKTPTPILAVGAIQINMLTGQVKCGVYNCNHEGQLSHKYHEDGSYDREWAEYQVLRILAHLGNHKTNNFPKFLAEPRINRDSDEAKLKSRTTTLLNKAYFSAWGWVGEGRVGGTEDAGGVGVKKSGLSEVFA